MAKPTSLASQLKRQDDATNLAAAKEDGEVVSRPAPKGKVWVRLIRPHYDSEGVLHMPGIASLDKGAVPESAKQLSKSEVTEADEADELDND